MKFISGLFGGGSAEREAVTNRQMNEVAIDRSMQEARDRAAEAAGDYAAGKVVRGRRLLMSSEAKGLASTLGGV